MRLVVEEAINKRAKIVATGDWETSVRGIPNPVESLGSYSRVERSTHSSRFMMLLTPALLCH